MNPEVLIIFVVSTLVTWNYLAATDLASREIDCNTDEDCPSESVCSATEKICFPDSDCTCPFDWKIYERSCYRAFGNKMSNYQNAKTFCEEHDSHIVIAETAEENEFLKGMLRRAVVSPELYYVAYRRYWLGLTNTSGVYTWDPTGDALTYEDWADDSSGECAYYTSFSNFQWEADDCYIAVFPFCEMPCVSN